MRANESTSLAATPLAVEWLEASPEAIELRQSAWAGSRALVAWEGTAFGGATTGARGIYAFGIDGGAGDYWVYRGVDVAACERV